MTAAGDSENEFFMRRAISLALLAAGDTHPNPLVGALIVENGKIVAEGFHARAGEPHAEIAALRALGRAPVPDATLYVTLEPCSTCGRTGACTDAILRAGIRRVIVGAVDPNPAHAGRGLEILKNAGVEIIAGISAGECTDINLIFNRWILKKSPLLALKTATTLDGKIATAAGESQWITGNAAREDVMRRRRYFPAIATSSGTVLADNPRLTARVAGEPEFCPTRFVFDRRLRLAEHPALNVFSDNFSEKTVIVTTAGNGDAARRDRKNLLQDRGVKIWEIEKSGAAFFGEFKARCADAGICGIWCEGGGAFLGALLNSGYADYFFQYVAPTIAGDAGWLPAIAGKEKKSLGEAVRLSDVRREFFGDDILIRGKI